MFIHSAQFAKWGSFEPIKINMILFTMLKTVYFSHLFFLILFLPFVTFLDCNTNFLHVILLGFLWFIEKYYIFLIFYIVFINKQLFFKVTFLYCSKLQKIRTTCTLSWIQIINACRLSTSTSSMAASLYVSFSTYM